MTCEHCGGDSAVVDSRSVGSVIRRRRRCADCNRRWTTWEIRSPESLSGPRMAAKLTEADVRNIHRWAEEGASVTILAKQLRVSPGAINHVLHGRRWRDERGEGDQ